jgi:hypothetical protein
MGQVIHLSVPWAAYPATTEALDTAERILLLGVRGWVADYRQSVDPVPRLCEAMRTAGPHDAAFSVDRLMVIIARTARRPVAIHCPHCPHLSRDETSVLYAASLVQAGERRMAERALRTALLSASTWAIGRAGSVVRPGQAAVPQAPGAGGISITGRRRVASRG